MTVIMQIHPLNPQPRLLQHVADILQQNGVIIFPTDSAYALGCKLGNRDGVERIRRIRGLDSEHNFTLICNDLSELATYAVVDNDVYSLLKVNTPGPYTFILPATKEVPRRFMHPKRKTVGLRIPDNLIVLALLHELGAPLMSVTLYAPNQEQPIVDVTSLPEWLENQVDLVIDGGLCDTALTTVIDFANGKPKILRVGKGDQSPFL